MALPQTVTVTFDGTQDTLPAAWANLGGTQRVFHGVTVTGGPGGVVAWLTGRSSTGATVNVSDRFSGTVELEIVTT